MCEALEDDLLVYTSRHARSRLKLIERGGAFVPFNPKSDEIQKTGFREKDGERVPVYWNFGRWHDSPT
jgi:hypothetical protein